jgi:carbon monoxide dehydrogenase subunit G
VIIEDGFVVKAKQDKVWNFLMDTESLAYCLPGCEKVEYLGDGVYKAVAAVQIAFMKLKFNLNVQITDMEAPTRLVSQIDGKPVSLVGKLKLKAQMELFNLSENETELQYHMDMSLAGKLGSLGQSAFRSKATEMGDQFADNIRKALETSKVQK